MISVMIVDDEMPALEELKYYLCKYPEVHVIGMYNNSLEAFKAIKSEKPDLIFLDIDMPYINGMEFALKIQDVNIMTEIVFVTAHDEFSLQAFEVNALDYILKPLSDERFKKTMTRVIDRCESKKNPDNTNEAIYIKCFGSFEVIKKGKMKNDMLKWRTAKTKELFLYLLYKHDKTVTKNELMDVLFEGFEEKKAQNNLYVTMFYLRKSLEEFSTREISIKENYGISVSPGMCDYIDFMRFLEDNPQSFDEDKLKECENMLEKYKGLYLEEEDYFWAIETREYLDRKYEELSLMIAQYYLSQNKDKKALNTLLRLLKINPLSEEGSRMILDIYISQKNKGLYIKFYKEYEKTLKEEYDLKPEKKYANYYIQIVQTSS